MSDEVKKNEDTVVYPIQTEPKPVYMRKGGEFIQVGEGIVTRHEDRTEIVMVLDEDANQFGDLLVTDGVMPGLIIGGRLSPDILGSLAKQGNLS